MRKADVNELGVSPGTPRIRLGAAVDRGPLELKLENLLPTGSVYDRIAGPLLEEALAAGPGPFLVAGCGSVCLSFAAVCMRAGVPIEFVVPAAALPEHLKLLRQHRAVVHRSPGASLSEATTFADTRLATVPGRLLYAPGRPELSRTAWTRSLVAELDQEVSDPTNPRAARPTVFVASGLSDLAEALGPRFSVRRVSSEQAGHQDGSFAAAEHAHEDVVSDREAFECRTRLATEEGLLLGYSTAAAVHAARRALDSGLVSAALVVALDAGDRYFSFDGRFAARPEV